jgi:uncharacterized protein (TIGR03437 family)
VSASGGISNTLAFPINAPAPSISSLGPNLATAGGPAFTLTVIGSGFLASSTVQWNGTALSTTYVSGTQLSASVPASQIASQGTASVTVFNFGVGNSNVVTFAVIAPTPSISSLSPNSVTAGGPPVTLTVFGSGFLAGSIVQWNGSALSTSYGSGTQLTASVPATLIANQGTASVTVVDFGAATSNAVTFTISASGGFSITSASALPGGTVGAPYSLALAATGGVTPYKTWTVITGNLPPGISLSALGGVLGGLLVGVPTTPGTFTFTVAVTDSANAMATKQFTIAISGGSPSISANGIVNAASYAGGRVSPGEIVAIFGSGLGPSTLAALQLDSRGYVSTSVAGTQVLFDGVAAPLIYTQAGQVSVVVPYEISGESATQVQVVYQGQTSNLVSMPVSSVMPGIFTSDASGQGPGAIVNQDGTLNSTGNPASVGSVVSVYATGEGQTDPQGVDGKLAASPEPQPVTQPVTATVGGIPAQVQYAGGAPTLVAGVLQVNILVPQAVAAGGSLAIQINIGGSSSQGNVTLAVKPPTGPQPFAMNSVSTTSPAPMTPLYISTTGVNASVPVMVNFSDGSGFSFTEQAIRVAADGTVVAAAPLYIDPASGTVASGTVSLALVQGNQSTAPITLNIQGLPPLSTYGTKLGDITHAFLVFEALTVAQQVNALQAIQQVPGNTVDVTHSLATLNTLLTNVLNARRDVDQIALNNNAVISAGMLPDGTPVQFDQSALDIADRLIGAYLTELAPVVTASSSGISQVSSARSAIASAPTLSLPVNASLLGFLPSLGYRFLRPDQSGRNETSGLLPSASTLTIPDILDIITESTNATAITQAIQSYFQSDALWSDKVLALGGGAATALGALPIPEAKQAGLALGALVGMASMASDITVELTDVAAMYYAIDNTANPNLQQVAYDDLKSTNAKLILDALQTELSLAAAGSGVSWLGPFGEKLCGELEAGLPGIALQSAALITDTIQMATSQGLSQNLETALNVAGQLIEYPFTSASQGIAEVAGTIQVGGNNGVVTPQYEVAVSNGTTSFTTIADPAGDYQVYVPLQTIGFDYTTATVTVSSSVGPLGSQTIDLSHLTTNVVLQVPTVSDWCANPPTFAASLACACTQMIPNTIGYWITCTPW